MATRSKRCSKCRDVFPEELFSRDPQKKDGLFSSCKSCRNKTYVENKANRIVYLAENRERILNSVRERYYKNRDKELLRIKDYRDLHRGEAAAYNKKYAREHYYGDVKYRLSRSVRTKIVRTIREGSKNRQRWESLVGYTADDLKNHLESMFNDGMSWGNYGKWHIDHVMPISFFNYKEHTDDTFKACWSLNNLQPLWAKENISKGGVARLNSKEMHNEHS